MLKLSNSVLQNTVYLVPKYLERAIKIPKFFEVLTIVLSTDEYYFKTNNQLSYSLYVLFTLIQPYTYFSPKNSLEDLKEGDMVDVLKTGKSFSDKVSWARGKVLELDDFDVKVEFVDDYNHSTVILRRDSYQIQPYQSKLSTYEWRMNLKEGDLVDY